MNPHPFDLKSRTALVTGSSRGIGRSIALMLAESGANVAIHYTGNGEQARDAAQAAAAFGVGTTVIRGDLEEPSAPKEIFEHCLSAFGQLDILVLNASIQIPKPWLTVSREDLERHVAVNFRSSFELLQLAVPGMVERGWGRILTVGSVQERKPNPEMIVYSSLKSAQTALGLSLAKQLAPHGITVNNLAPGVIETDRYHERVTTPEFAEKVRSWIPAGYPGQARDCAGAALLLCSDAGRYVTGQNIYVDGGMGL